jgi:hypothetical protein
MVVHPVAGRRTGVRFVRPPGGVNEKAAGRKPDVCEIVLFGL